MVSNDYVFNMLAYFLRTNWLLIFAMLRYKLVDLFNFYVGCVVIFNLKNITVFCIKVYQKFAPIKVRSRCCFTPSCSDYAILALQKYGMLKGCKMVIDRLIRCHPPGGIDYP